MYQNNGNLKHAIQYLQVFSYTPFDLCFPVYLESQYGMSRWINSDFLLSILGTMTFKAIFKNEENSV